jgi:hypothetical protein
MDITVPPDVEDLARRTRDVIGEPPRWQRGKERPS